MKSGNTTPGGTSFTLIALAEVRGQIAPCGCNSDPLGDLSRTAKLVEAARSTGPTLVLDAGSLLYSQAPVPPNMVAQEDLKADLIVSTYKKMQIGAVGLGPADIPLGPAKLRIPRQAVNLPASAGYPLDPPHIVEVGGQKIGVFGVIALDTLPPTLKVDDPVATGKTAIAGLKKDGAQLVVALVQASSKRDAVQLVKQLPGVDVAVAGLGINAPEPEHVETEATKAGDAWMIFPSDRGQVIARMEITLRDGGVLVDAGGKAAADAKIAYLDKQIRQLDDDLKKMDADPTADKGFVKQKHEEHDRYVAEKAGLVANPLTKPEKGSYFTLEQVRVAKALACDVGVQTSVLAYNKSVGELNLKAAAGQPPPAPPGNGGPTYVGDAACEDCHGDASAFWKKTVHAQAWQTLVDRGQQFDLECISCHVTGWDKPGGSNLANNDKLRNVQCEMCHGPASIHVAKGGEEKPPAIVRTPKETLCNGCHTKEHSDTFDHTAYLRDIVGPGHGEDLRKQLGDGPTGAQLRKAGLDKAGRTMGAGCVR